MKELITEIRELNNILEEKGITTVSEVRKLKEEVENIHHLTNLLEKRLELIRQKENEVQKALNIRQKVKDFYEEHSNISKWFKTHDLGFNNLEDVKREKENIKKLYEMSYELEEYYLYERINLDFVNFIYKYKKNNK